ncbi:MAG: hypothetical protein A2X49_15605 [Lentisphaerae bacterium GWF2_52_8]|nr:MAG: hypothetical protein A2X49_15605 [Lentisphaerae bacterium GWF2_52_8]
MTKKNLILLSGLCLFSIALHSEDSVIYMKDNREIKSPQMEADANGSISYKDGAVKLTVKKNAYNYAWVPKPAEINAIEKLLKGNKFKEAADAVPKINPQYKFLGWELTITYLDAAAQAGLGNKAAAIKKLEDFKKYEIIVPEKQEPQLMDIYKLLTSLYIEAGNFNSAEEIFALMGKAKDESVAAVAFNGRGDILYKQGKKKEAVLMYLQTALLFPETNTERPEALFKAASILKTDLKDSRGEKFAEMLKKDYPSSTFVGQLK